MKNPSGRPDKFQSTRGPEKGDRRKAAEAAGMSRHQMYQAMKVAEIAESDFERLIESDNPPTLTELAAHGASRSNKSEGQTMTRAEATAAIQKALDAAHAAYWAACDAEGRAIEPAALSAPDGLLDEAYEAALMVEGVAVERGLSWQDARDYV